MKLAIAHWQGRVSPVFDVAGNALIVGIDAGGVCSRQDVALLDEDAQKRAAFLAGTGAEVLICGAVSWPLEIALVSAGIEVIAQTCGEVEAVLAAFVNGGLNQGGFLMPGCCGRRRFRARRGRGGGRMGRP